MFQKPKLAIQDFDYPLSDAKIAYTPCVNRSDSKLLVWDQSIIAESHYSHIAAFIPADSTLIFNNSKVIAARILFEKNNNANTIQTESINDKKQNSVIEIFCLEPTETYTPVLLAMQATQKVSWHCLVGGAKKWKEAILHKEIIIRDETISFYAKKIAQADGKFIIEFSWNHPSIHFSEILTVIGNIPLPPYIQRKATEQDKDRYQTTYAIEEGSVAAPTAGLHFNEQVFKSLDEKNILQKYLTLHVGAGTFMPVKSATIDEHNMHAEFIEVDLSLIMHIKEKACIKDKPIIAVGTTSMRTIESLYWLGVKAFLNTKSTNEIIQSQEMHLGQWDAYELAPHLISVQDAMDALMQYLKQHQTNKLFAKTQLMVTPGYAFKICNALVTNFHQPKSTLLLIIAAITGDEWKKIYAHALENDYRFLSYGDGSLLWIHNR